MNSHINNKTISVIYKALIVVLSLFSLLLQFKVFEGLFDFAQFNYFTILSNIIALIYFCFAIIFESIKKNEKSFAPVFKGLVTISLMITMFVSYFILVDVPNTFSLKMLHFVIPLLVIFDWLIFDLKGQLRYDYIITWIVVPTLYLAYVFMMTALGKNVGDNSLYPYPFLDITSNGITNVILTIGFLYFAFITISYLFVLLDKTLRKLNKKVVSVNKNE